MSLESPIHAVIRSAEEMSKLVLQWHDRGIFNGKPFRLTLANLRAPRTNSQNRKLHALFREIAKYTGYSEREIKELIKVSYGPVKPVSLNGEQRAIAKPTHEYSIDELSCLIERCHQIAAEIGCTVRQ